LEHFWCFHILGRIIPTDFHIFQRGRYTTNQILYHSLFAGDLHHLLLGWPADRMIRYLYVFVSTLGGLAKRLREMSHQKASQMTLTFHIIPHHFSILGFLDVLGNIIIYQYILYYIVDHQMSRIIRNWEWLMDVDGQFIVNSCHFHFGLCRIYSSLMVRFHFPSISRTFPASVTAGLAVHGFRGDAGCRVPWSNPPIRGS